MYQWCRHTKTIDANYFGSNALQLLFQHVQRAIAIVLRSSTHFWFGQCSLVHLLILIQWNTLYLHRNSRHHIRRLLVHDEGVERLHIYGLFTHDIGCNELAASFILKGLYGNVFDIGIFSYHALHLFQFDAEATNLHLSIATPNKFQIAIGQVAYDVARSVAASPRALYKGFGRLLRTIQIAATYLWTAHPQFSQCANRLSLALHVNNIQMHILHSLANRNILYLLLHSKCRHIADTLRWTIAVE